MKVYLDDERATPEGWVRAWWPDEVIALLETGQVSELSLDHDLGDDPRGTGYDVILWVEEAVALRGSCRRTSMCIRPIPPPWRGCAPGCGPSRRWRRATLNRRGSVLPGAAGRRPSRPGAG